MIKCKKCGKIYPEEYSFCPFCNFKDDYDGRMSKISSAIDLLISCIELNYSQKNLSLVNEKAENYANYIVNSNFTSSSIEIARKNFIESVANVPILTVKDPKYFIIKTNPRLDCLDGVVELKKEIKKLYSSNLECKVLFGLTCNIDEDSTVIVPNDVTVITGTYKEESLYVSYCDEWDHVVRVDEYCFKEKIKNIILPPSLKIITSSAFKESPIEVSNVAGELKNYSSLKINVDNESFFWSSGNFDKCYICGIEPKEYFKNKDVFLPINFRIEDVDNVIRFLKGNCKSIHIVSELKICNTYDVDMPVIYHCINRFGYNLRGKITILDTTHSIGNNYNNLLKIVKLLSKKHFLKREFIFCILNNHEEYEEFLKSNIIQNAAFVNGEAIKSISLTQNIATNYQINNPLIEHISILEGNTIIPDYAFKNCYSLREIRLSSTIRKIGKCAFDGCESLTSIVLPDDIENIPDRLFDGCSNLVEVALPKHCKKIGKEVFYDCKKLFDIVLPDSIKEADQECFLSSFFENITIYSDLGNMPLLPSTLKNLVIKQFRIPTKN